MSNPILELRSRLFKQTLQTSGEIIEVLQNSTYRVRTVSGSLEVKAAGNAAFAVGDEVLVRDGIIQGFVKKLSTVPVYTV